MEELEERIRVLEEPLSRKDLESRSRGRFGRNLLLKSCSTHQGGKSTPFICLISSKDESRSEFLDQNDFLADFYKNLKESLIWLSFGSPIKGLLEYIV